MNLEKRQLDGLIHEMLGNTIVWYLYPFGISVPAYTKNLNQEQLNDLTTYFLKHNPV